MAKKLLGLGTVVKATDTAVTLLTNITPPPRSRALIDGTALEDDLATNELGIEEHSEFTFTQFWEPGDTQHETIDADFDSKATKTYKIEYTNSPQVTDSFSGKVSRIAPQPIEINGLVQREVTIQRLTAITRATAGG